MAYIPPSRTFQGSDMAGPVSRIVKSDVNQLLLSESKYSDGVYLFILPPYKQDANGNGVWYKVISVRDNFGLEEKKKFLETEKSPVAYFARNARVKFPEYAKTQKVERDGRTQNVYPPFGRIQKRVLFNVALFDNLEKGAHVLDVPNFSCADVIDKYHRTRLPDGNCPPLVCQADCACPVFFKLDLKSKGNPWEVRVESSKRFKLPDEIIDPENLINLDEALNVPNNQDLYNDLKNIAPKEIFEECMRGYSFDETDDEAVVESRPVALVSDSKAPTSSKLTPVSVSAAAAAPVVAGLSAAQAAEAKEVVSSDKNPVRSFDPEEMKAWLKEKKTK